MEATARMAPVRWTDREMLDAWAAHVGDADSGSPGPALKRFLSSYDALRSAAVAALAYDAAIQSCANEPEKMASFCSAEGDDLDALYADWIDKSRAAIEKASS